MGNHSLVVSMLQPLVIEEPEFLAGRKLLREAQILRSRGKSGGFLGRSGGGLSLGKSKALKCIEAGDIAGAMLAAEKALENDPTSPQANRDLFEAAEAVARKEREALAPVKAEFESAPDGDAKVEAARKLQTAGSKLRTYEAIARFALETIGLDPKNTKAKHELGDYLMRIEEYEEASKVFDEILRKNPVDLDARDRAKESAARRSMQRGRLDKSSFADLVKQRQVAAESGDEKVATASETPEDLAQRVYEAHEAGAPDREAARKLADLYFNRDDFENALQYYRYLSSLANDTDPGLLRKISDAEVRQISRAISEKESASRRFRRMIPRHLRCGTS